MSARGAGLAGIIEAGLIEAGASATRAAIEPDVEQDIDQEIGA